MNIYLASTLRFASDNRTASTLLFYENKHKKVFRNVLLKKQACLDNRNMDLKQGNLDIFLKRIVHNLVKKLKIFLLFLSKIDREKVFIDGLDRKEALKDNKNRSL